MRTLFEKKTPIYLQLIDLFKQLIVSGNWKENTYIDSVRDLAMTYQVNPNTVFKALSELENQGLLINDRTVGKKVTDDKQLIQQMKLEMLQQAMHDFLKQAYDVGYSKQEVLEMMKKEGEKV